MASEPNVESKSTPSDVKNGGACDEVKNVGDTKDKSDLKNEAKEDSGQEDSEDDIEEEEEVALLDRPVEVTGCRARKKVERLEVSFSAPKEKQEFPEGKGKKLGECPRIDMQIQKMRVPDLKTLHKILFNRTGSANEIKKNIRKFCGFAFEKDSSEFNRKKAAVEKFTALVLKKVCIILDIERGGTKEEIVNRIVSFLMNPEDSGKKVPFKKKEKSKKENSKEKKKTTKGKSDLKMKPLKDSSDDEPDESIEDVHEHNSSGGETSVDGSEEEINDDTDKPKKKSKASKRTSKIEKGNGDNKKHKGTKRKQDDSSASSEDEPAIKQSKMPSDEEISKLVKQILESADLQEITMKKVIKQVSDAYPEFDLSHKKSFIKATIKSVIS